MWVRRETLEQLWDYRTAGSNNTFPVVFSVGPASISDAHASNRQASSSALVALGEAVESAVSDEARVSTPTVDVFVRESLFPLAVSSAKRSLEVAAREERGMVAWGNTNTQVSLYQSDHVSIVSVLLWKCFLSAPPRPDILAI